jgi:DNA-binding NtrC family response regulator
LFGHVRGAFTGADGDRRIGPKSVTARFCWTKSIVPLAAQVKLLRAAEERL